MKKIVRVAVQGGTLYAYILTRSTEWEAIPAWKKRYFKYYLTDTIVVDRGKTPRQRLCRIEQTVVSKTTSGGEHLNQVRVKSRRAV